jgi:hypothetical protein
MGLDHHLYHVVGHWSITDRSSGSHSDHKHSMDDIILLLRSHMGSHTVGPDMKLLYQALSLLPAPLFFLGFVFSLVFGHHGVEMAVMWFIMMLAHVTPWLIWWQQRDFTRR